jgi:opacity protein-like surface antigen
VSASARRALLSLGAVVGVAAAWAAVAVAAPPENTTAPTIDGSARVGQTLTAQNGTWSNSPTAFRYQWLRCDAAGAACASIAGAVEKTYLVTNADADRTLRVVVFASNIEGVSSARSAQTNVVAQSTASQNTRRPTISGEAEVGEQLTANEGTWTNSPTSFQYRWQRCDVDGLECQAIQLAQSKNYQVRAADVGFRLRVRVLAFNAAGIGAAVSDPSGVVVPSTPVTLQRPSLVILSVRILGNRVHARFRICDDHPRNLRIFATDSKPGVKPQVRRFSTLVPPNPCGVYTRKWVPARKFRTKGRYTVMLQVRDAQGIESVLRKKTFTLR